MKEAVFGLVLIGLLVMGLVDAAGRPRLQPQVIVADRFQARPGPAALGPGFPDRQLCKGEPRGRCSQEQAGQYANRVVECALFDGGDLHQPMFCDGYWWRPVLLGQPDMDDDSDGARVR